MTFNEVIGQEAIKNQLRQMVRNDRMPHALMLLGPEGSGKLTMGLAFAQYVLCSNRSETDACGSCTSCRKVQKLIHPDLHFSFPFISKHKTSDVFLKQWRTSITENPYLNMADWMREIEDEKAQGNITKDECVSIVKKLSLKVFEGSHKILLMWRPEYLGKEGNRLLKLIEEPPENTLFIFVAETPEKILNTILSRVQIVKMPALTDEQIVAALTDKGIGLEAAQQAAFLSDGNLNEALKMTRQTDQAIAGFFIDWLSLCFTGNATKLVEWVQNVANFTRENQKYFLRYGLQFLREFMLLKLDQPLSVKLQEPELSRAKRMAHLIDFQQIEPLSTLINDSIYYVERNANPKPLFLDVSIKIHHIMNGHTVVV